jgi:hypothetical protein
MPTLKEQIETAEMVIAVNGDCDALPQGVCMNCPMLNEDCFILSSSCARWLTTWLIESKRIQASIEADAANNQKGAEG